MPPLFARLLDWFGSRFSQRAIAILTLLFCAGVVAALWSTSHLSWQLIQSQALRNAEATLQTMQQAQALYSDEAVTRARPIPGITITHNYTEVEGGIPLPATYLIQLADRISENNQEGVVTRLYSDYPFPWRSDGGPRDDFEARALTQVRSHPQDPYYSFETFQGRQSLRFAAPSIMKDSCVQCHNNHPDSPKTNWQVGDVRGVLEVIQPLDQYIAATHRGLRGNFAMMGSLSFLGICGLTLSVGRLRQESRLLEKRVRERTASLNQANEQIQSLNERLKAENLRMSAELDVTRRLQNMILPHPHELSSISDLDIDGYMDPAEEVGGDYYDVLQENGSVNIGIGDVTGHGLESGVLMIMVQTAVRTLVTSQEKDPQRFMNILNKTIYENVRRMNSDRNLSLALLNYEQGRLRLSGQHEEVIMIRAHGAIERIDTTDLGFPIGLEAEIDRFIAHIELELHAGDVVVLYTDGITEAENDRGQFYGTTRLCELVRSHRLQPAAAIRRAIIADVRQHIGQHKVFDDITLVVVKKR